MFWLDLYVIETDKVFRKYFECEFDRDKFRRKIKFSKRIMVVESDDEWY